MPGSSVAESTNTLSDRSAGRTAALHRLPKKALRHLFESVIACRAGFLKDALDVRAQTRFPPAQPSGFLRCEHFTDPRAIEQGARGGRVIARVIAGREAVIELRAEIRGIVAEEGA